MKHNNTLIENIICCIQARIGSSRLPGKVMLKFIGKPVIQHIIERLKRCKGFSKIVILTSTEQNNDELVDFLANFEVDVLRGSENDVLSRFVQAQQKYHAEHIVRICADNPVVDPIEVDKIIHFHKENMFDFSFNNVPLMDNNYPDGVGGEVFTKNALLTSFRLAISSQDKEHANRFVLKHSEQFRIGTIKAHQSIAYPNLKLDVDNIEDFHYLSEIFSHFKNNYFITKEIINYLKETKRI